MVRFFGCTTRKAFDHQRKFCGPCGEGPVIRIEHCHRSAVSNKARCAFYLIPVKMLLGELPQQAMLDKFGLHDYSPIIEAMKEGIVEGLDRCLEEHQIRFIQAGTYLLLEKLKKLVYRCLFRRVALLHKEQEPAKAAQVPLQTCL
ncbi:probable PCI domain-containing protein 2 [Coccomyxa sp. Obi]|nr:probable PCI domain-containing protein 2 [Coccomyxa sp. Obi]